MDGPALTAAVPAGSQLGEMGGRVGSQVDGEMIGGSQVGCDGDVAGADVAEDAGATSAGAAGLAGVEVPGAGLVDGAGVFFFLRTGRSGVSTAALRSSTGCFRAGGAGSGGGTHGGAFFGGTAHGVPAKGL